MAPPLIWRALYLTGDKTEKYSIAIIRKTKELWVKHDASKHTWHGSFSDPQQLLPAEIVTGAYLKNFQEVVGTVVEHFWHEGPQWSITAVKHYDRTAATWCPVARADGVVTDDHHLRATFQHKRQNQWEKEPEQVTFTFRLEPQLEPAFLVEPLIYGVAKAITWTLPESYVQWHLTTLCSTMTAVVDGIQIVAAGEYEFTLVSSIAYPELALDGRLLERSEVHHHQPKRDADIIYIVKYNVHIPSSSTIHLLSRYALSPQVEITIRQICADPFCDL